LRLTNFPTYLLTYSTFVYVDMNDEVIWR